jgi:hypothetical protein
MSAALVARCAGAAVGLEGSMKIFLGWTVVASLAAGCGGNVVVDRPAGTGGATTTTTSGTTTPTTTTGTSTSGGPCSMTCGQTLKSGGPAPCGGNALTFYDVLLSCACGGGPCATNCTYTFCAHQGITPTDSCAMCLELMCGQGAFMNCLAN